MLTEKRKLAIKQIIANIVLEDVNEIKDETKLSEDLGFDTLDIIDLIVELEAEFSIHIDEIDAAEWKTVKDVFDALSKFSFEI